MSVDQIPLPSTAGSLWLCGRADVGPDPDGLLASVGATTVVCLNPVQELERRFPAYVEWLNANRGGRALWYPIPNFSAPSATQALPFLRMITARLEAGQGVVMHCAAGQGRAGTMAVCILMLLGASRHDALGTVAAHRTFAGPGDPSQWRLVEGIGDLLDDESDDALG